MREVSRIPATPPVRWRVHRLADVDSTNRFALDAARAGERGGFVVVADHQTAGRGRLDREWIAPAGTSLLVSVLLRPADAVVAAQRAVMGAALSLADAVQAVAGFAPDLKWPNDLVVGERKLAGILAEREGDALVVGAGCNVEWVDFPAELRATATACNLEIGAPVDRDALLDAYLESLEAHLDRPDTIPVAYRARLVTLGQRVRVERVGGALVGDAIDVDDEGTLLVRDDSRRDHRVAAGDIVHLRPSD